MSVSAKLDAAWYSLGGYSVSTAVHKATSRDVMGPKKKHVDYLLQCTNNELMNLNFMQDMLLEKCRMSTWVIVSKALVTFHSLLSNGNERFFQLLSARTSLWDLENFLDKTAVTGYDMSSFIKRYSKYLMQKVHSYREMNYDFCRAKRGPEGVLRTLPTDKLLKALTEIQIQIQSLLDVDLQSSEFSNGVINSAFVLLFKDLIKLFACYNDGMINLLEKYYDMKKENCKESLAIYKTFLSTTEQVSKFLKVAEDIGVNQDVIPDLAKAPDCLLKSLENHYRSLEKGQVPMPSKKDINLAPITISVKSEQFNFKEDEAAEQFSPEEYSNVVDGQTTLIQSAQSANPGGEGPWQSVVEPDVPQSKVTTDPSDNKNDLFELSAVFEAQQAPANAFQPSSNFGAPVNSQTVVSPPSVNQTTNPLEMHPEALTSGDILQPMNRPAGTTSEAQFTRQISTGDLYSSLSKVALSLDNFNLTSAAPGQGSTGHQWTAPKPKVITGGANYQIGTTASTTIPPGNPISQPLPHASPTAPGMAQPQPMLRSGYTHPQTLGQQQMAYGQRPQNKMSPVPQATMNPFDNPAHRNQALF